MRLCKALLLLLLAFWVLGGQPCLAGVVEDAEDSLQTVPTDNPAGQHPLDGSGAGTTANSSSSRSASLGSTASTTDSRGSTGLRITGAGGQGLGGGDGVALGAVPTPPAAERASTERRKAQDRSDTAMSLMGVLVLLGLVVAAGVYSKRAGRDD